jgi:endonuclease G
MYYYLVINFIIFVSTWSTDISNTTPAALESPANNEISFSPDDPLIPEPYTLWPQSTTNQVVDHTYFRLSYAEKHEQAEWVAYWLTPLMIEGEAKRRNDFREDPLISTGSASLADYKGSGFDRGHLAPAADFKFDATAMSESFYMSNMSPQRPSFNRGIWRILEEQVREWATENDSLFIVTGGVLTDSLHVIGENEGTVPDLYYKIIFYADREEAKAFILPNQKVEDPLDFYVVSVDSVESITGIDFFPDLPDDLETRIEKESGS